MEEKKSQLDKFKEAARQLETDDDEERFEERLKKLVKPGDSAGRSGGDADASKKIRTLEEKHKGDPAALRDAIFDEIDKLKRGK